MRHVRKEKRFLGETSLVSTFSQRPLDLSWLFGDGVQTAVQRRDEQERLREGDGPDASNLGGGGR